jgi:hypothetical protein
VEPNILPLKYTLTAQKSELLNVNPFQFTSHPVALGKDRMNNASVPLKSYKPVGFP